MRILMISAILACPLLVLSSTSGAAVVGGRDRILIAAHAGGTPQVQAKDEDADDDKDEDETKDEKKETPEQSMNQRFPQPVRAGDLIGQPVLDDDHSTMGRVQHVVRTSEGKIQLIVPYGGLFGWGARLVPVPIEVVTSRGRQIVAIDMPREDFDTAPTWYGSNTTPISPDEIIKIAVAR